MKREINSYKQTDAVANIYIIEEDSRGNRKCSTQLAASDTVLQEVISCSTRNCLALTPTCYEGTVLPSQKFAFINLFNVPVHSSYALLHYSPNLLEDAGILLVHPVS